MLSKVIEFFQETYASKDVIPLHAPVFLGNEKEYVANTIDSTFVSSVGKYVDQFEREIESFTGTPKAVATVNGSAALHAALYMIGARRGDLVITQALTFVATCNALYHMGVEPVFVDVSTVSMGLCPKALADYLENNACSREDGKCVHRKTGQVIRAVLPMHTFGHPVELNEILAVCEKWNLSLVEDSAESLGSFYRGQHTGTFGQYGAISFNGNKIITTGGGGMVLCSSLDVGVKVKHITTTAKSPHPYEFYHDEAGFNYRLPNINAALGCAQMEALSEFLVKKRALANKYEDFFSDTDLTFFKEPSYAESNYWLNAVICPDQRSRDELLKSTNERGIMTRPIWRLMNHLPMYANCKSGNLDNSLWFEERVVNIPSSVGFR
jgi:aminotransferase in exopolysaccharide biosynthesis